MAYHANPLVEDFKLYSAIADAATGPAPMWNSSQYWSFAAGRFSGEQGMTPNGLATGAATMLYKDLGETDASIICALSFIQNIALGGATEGLGIQLLDGVTAQVTVMFRTDGSVIVRSGGTSGTIVATFPGVFTQATWLPLQIEIVVGTSGSVSIWKNGQTGALTSPDHSATGINTQGGTGAAQYSRVSLVSFGFVPFGMGAGNQVVDSFRCWNETDSGVAAGPYQLVGDCRPEILLPDNDAAIQFSDTAPFEDANTFPYAASTDSRGAGTVTYSAYTPARNFDISEVQISLNAPITGHVSFAVWDSDGLPRGSTATPGTVLGSGTITNPVGGNNVITMTSPVRLVRGHLYFVALDQDVTTVYQCTFGFPPTYPTYTGTTSYGSFPAANPAPLTTFTSGNIDAMTLISVENYASLAEPKQDGSATYVTSQTAGDRDLYGLDDLTDTPTNIDTVVVRLLAWKTDAGAREGQIEWLSGATTADSTAEELASTPGYLNDVRGADPNTGAAWTAGAVNALEIGPKVAA
jgi:hypothetical protein